MTSHPPICFSLALACLAAGASALDRAHSDTMTVPSPARVATAPVQDTAIFAGGSFWCLEPAFEALPGVDSVTAGYIGDGSAGGKGPGGPDFESVSADNSGYVEAVRVYFRPKRIGYAKLLDTYWKNIDPTRTDGQFSDIGAPFRTFIFYRDNVQKTAAYASRRRLENSKRFPKPIVTAIAPATAFHPAEAEHQDYYKHNAPRYQTYLKFSGREVFFRKAWGKARAETGPAAGAGKSAPK